MKFNVEYKGQVREISQDALKSVIASHLPEWAVESTLEHMVDNYHNSNEDTPIRLDELAETTSPYEVIDFEEAKYRCSNMIDEEDEEDDGIVIEIIEEWLEGYLDTNELYLGCEFLVFNR